MGLDNIPARYPCTTEGTAVRTDEGRIDCRATQVEGGCPWQRDLGREPGAILGMMGTDCWYRGKVANWMLDRLEGAGAEPPLTFYGSPDAFTDDDGDPCEGLSPEMCAELSSWMVDHAEQYARLFGTQEPDVSLEEEVGRYRYAAKWLAWAGTVCEGSAVWY